jgi:hypothetical protein
MAWHLSGGIVVQEIQCRNVKIIHLQINWNQYYDKNTNISMFTHLGHDKAFGFSRVYVTLLPSLQLFFAFWRAYRTVVSH